MSLRNHIINFVVQARQARMRNNLSLEDRRMRFENISRKLPLARGTEVVTTENRGITGEWLIPAKTASDTIIMHCHGGGYIMGSPASHRSMLSWMAHLCKCKVFSFDYRLAPEHPFPAGLEDAEAVYRWLLDEGFPARDIILSGDSAGGGMAVAMAVKLREKGVALPAALVLLSPWVDLTLAGVSIDSRKTHDILLSPDLLRIAAKLYTAEHPADDPLISPLFADLSGLPPVLIQAGSKELLLSDAVRLAGALQKAGSEAELQMWDNVMHVWHFTAAYLPEARRAIQSIHTFIRSKTGQVAV